MKSGRVVFLNGTSSSGKTTIARALQERLVEPYMYISVDGFFHLYPEKYLEPKSREEAVVLSKLVPRVVSGLHRCVAALAGAGNDLIVDHVLQEPGWLEECVVSWTSLKVLFVGVKCPLEIAEQREKERGDREIGTARYQFERVHAHGFYDIELDTSLLNLEQCTNRILASLQDYSEWSAFQKLADRYSSCNRQV